MSKPVFYDPQRKRWRRLRRIFDSLALSATVLGILFIVGLLRMKPMQGLDLRSATKRYRALYQPKPELRSKERLNHSKHRRSDVEPSDVTMNQGEGLRAAFYTDADPASFASFKAHIKQIDLLFPEWLHVVTPDGSLVSYTSDNIPFAVVDKQGVHSVDRENKIVKAITAAKEDTDIFPLVNNYSPVDGVFEPDVEQFMVSATARDNFIEQVDEFMAANTRYRGITLDFQALPTDAKQGYDQLIQAVYRDFHAKNLKVYINVPVTTSPADMGVYAANADGLILMNYGEHQDGTPPGPVAGQDWFEQNLQNAMKVVPKDKIICSIGAYGYDWTTPLPEPVAKGKRRRPAKKPADIDDDTSATNLSTQEVWQEASDAGAQIDLDDASLNPHFAYDDEDAKMRHEIWFLDAVTALNQMRVARALGLQTFALWRLGSEDDSLWKIWDSPLKADPAKDLATVSPGQDIDTEGDGDIIRVTGLPQNGQRTLEMDDDPTIPKQYLSVVSESMTSYPLPYTVTQYGYHPKKVAISFDDGPDPTWTPKILDILKKYNVKGTFFMIGEVAQENVGVMQRVFREGHEIGNHTYSHPDISEISTGQVDLQLNLTEELFAAKLGVNPVYFRPPYSIDQEPDTNDQAEPVEHIQKRGYVIVGDKIDTDDWDENPRKSPQQIINSVFEQIEEAKTKPWMRGSIILMHDGGGDRSATVAALPKLIEALRAHGYEIVPVSQLIGLSRDQVMVPLTQHQKYEAMVDSVAFFLIGFFNHFVIWVFFLGDILMSGRLIVIGLFAIIDRFRKRKEYATADYNPRVAVLIPAYNEEMVIARTIRSVLMSNYKNIRIIVIDDGSKDETYKIATETYAKEIADGRVTVLTKPNGGKAEALNFALQQTNEEIYVGIDADGVIAHDAIARLVCHFANPHIGAVAGNAKVGNRVNLWTRWQALEYITSQNFERRALDLFDVVMVVPGAIGAWRTAAVKAGGGYHPDTVAEDADLTMNLLEQGYAVIYEDQALAFTEAPVTANGLARQRFRWSFGILQAVFKHRGAIRNRRAMGLFALPNIVVFQIVLPLVSPLIDFMFVAGVIHYFIDKYYHPETTNPADLVKLLTFFGAFLIIDFIASALAFLLERKHPASKGDAWLLVHIWLQRFTYRQLFSWVLFKTVKRAIDGKPFSWDKLERTAKMSKHTEQLTGE
ncbi:glycosyltransferase [Granulicella sp. 5B5]|uniref:polysaccharide deacetylase family protein n=1 Tax=Granulicella sp. 5B5 TaxID=1617967 RepID=UPI0015F48075|nr:polysaccharide deacetylase family protein [Granulicella sp. 5B5]QMV17303.1 glycosyltransferase [Granulicella sp. 5B5]